EALDLARLGLGQLVEELDGARILMAADMRLDHVRDLALEPREDTAARLQHHVRLHDVPAQRVRHPDHRCLRDRRMLQYRALDFEGTDAIARALDDVVRASLGPEVPVRVAAREISDRHPTAPVELTSALGIVPVPERVVAFRMR